VKVSAVIDSLLYVFAIIAFIVYAITGTAIWLTIFWILIIPAFLLMLMLIFEDLDVFDLF
jgi:hypothetical protein